MSDQRQRRDVFTVIEREGRKSFWVKIGSSFENRDGSVSVLLDALPVNGKLQIRDALPRDGYGYGGRQQRQPDPFAPPDEDLPL
jgi:hypothetical protein